MNLRDDDDDDIYDDGFEKVSMIKVEPMQLIGYEFSEHTQYCIAFVLHFTFVLNSLIISFLSLQEITTTISLIYY